MLPVAVIWYYKHLTCLEEKYNVSKALHVITCTPHVKL